MQNAEKILEILKYIVNTKKNLKKTTFQRIDQNLAWKMTQRVHLLEWGSSVSNNKRCQEIILFWWFWGQRLLEKKNRTHGCSEARSGDNGNGDLGRIFVVWAASFKWYKFLTFPSKTKTILPMKFADHTLIRFRVSRWRVTRKKMAIKGWRTTRSWRATRRRRATRR